MATDILEYANTLVWGPVLLALVLGVGIYFTLRTGGVQVRYIGKAFRCLLQSEGTHGGISPFAVLCTALAAAIGTGNIVGVATAVAIGGPGALFWMLVSAFFGMATKYAEGVLAVKYRMRDKTGFYGGPFYYIERGMGRRFRWLGKGYALFGALAGLCGIGTLTQSNSIAAAAERLADLGGLSVAGEHKVSVMAVLVSVVVTVLAAPSILGGVHRVARVTAVLVPVMLAVYVGAIGLILWRNAAAIPAALSLIVRSAFSPQAALGAAGGVTVGTAIRLGIGRGVFSNEAGMGTEAIAAAASNTSSPMKQGLVCMLSTFMDTVVLCTVAGLVLVVTGTYTQGGTEGVAMTADAWAAGLPFSDGVSRGLLLACLIFFAFSTIIGWGCYAEGCMRYLCGNRRGWMRLYKALYILAVFMGPYVSVSTVWTVADLLNGCMLFPNLTALLSLGGVVARQTRVEVEKTCKKGKKALDVNKKG